MIVKTHRHTFTPAFERSTFLMWCECAYCHTIEPIHSDGVYHTIPWPRWHVDPALSMISVIEVDRFVCDVCFDGLPE